MNDQGRVRPIPGSRPSMSVPDQALWNGDCPVCRKRVLWVIDRSDSADGSVWHAPLEPEFERLPFHPSSAYVLVSSTGEATAVSPVVHPVHHCDPAVVREVLTEAQSLGFYTSEVLATACPVRFCRAAPGMLCLTQRREALYRPHGARAATARGEALEDPAF